MFKTIIKKCFLIPILLTSSCSGSASSISSLEQEIINCTSFKETKQLLLDNLTEDNVEELNELAINYAIYKPMYRCYNIQNDYKEYVTTFGYCLNQNRGNDAYRKALDNIYFRKALFALFTHTEYALTSNYYKSINAKPNNYCSTYKFRPSSKEIVILEGIEEAKNYYQKAKETGLSDDPIELYLMDLGIHSELFLQHLNLIKTNFEEVFGSLVYFTYKVAGIDLDYSSLAQSKILMTYVDFFAEVNLDYYSDMYSTIMSIFSDFSYLEQNKICRYRNDNMHIYYDCEVYDTSI